MSRLVRVLTLSIFASSALLGCKGSSDKLVGSWQASSNGVGSQFHFFKDGHFTLRMMQGGMVVDAEGNYKVDGDRLEMNPTKSVLGGTDEELKARAAPFINQAARVHMRWNNPMSVTLMTGPSDNLTLGRMSDTP